MPAFSDENYTENKLSGKIPFVPEKFEIWFRVYLHSVLRHLIFFNFVHINPGLLHQYSDSVNVIVSR